MRENVPDVLRLPIFLMAQIFLFLVVQPKSYAQEKQPVMGAGPSTVVVELFFKHFSSLPAARGYEFIVEPRSIKHAGGIKASGKYLFGRTGRPLNKKEKAQNKHDLFVARIPLAFVVGEKAGVKRITTDQLEAIFSRRLTNWQALGGADADIILAGREPTEAAFSIIRRDHPFFSKVEFDLILTRDHQLVNFIKSSMGDYAIGFGARPNFDDAYLLRVDGFKSGLNLGLVYDTKNMDHPVVKAATEFAGSEAWHMHVGESGLLPPD